MLTTSERAILSAELTNDPLARGYSAMGNADVVASLRTQNRSRIRARMDSSEVFQAVDVTEFLAKTDQQQRNLMAVMSFGWLNPQGKEATLFTNIFGAGSATITALAAARLETVSRAVELAIPNVIVDDVVAVRGG